MGDAVDEILVQWERERPDVDVSAMGIIGRISRAERLIRVELAAVFAAHGLESWEFDVLATLRRSGAPYELSAGSLLSSMMISSGAITNRIDRLEGRRLVVRRNDRSDGRMVLIRLTALGRKKVDAALGDHAANELRLVSSLSERDRDQLAGLLRRLHVGWVSSADG